MINFNPPVVFQLLNLVSNHFTLVAAILRYDR